MNHIEGGVKEKDGIAPTLLAMKDFFPALIGTPDVVDDYSSKSVMPFIKIEMDMEKSFLMKPVPDANTKDTVGTWPADQKWPTSDKYFSPTAGDSDVNNILDHKIPCKIMDDDIRKFLNAKTLVQNNKIVLPTYIFDPPSINIDSKSKFNVLDSIARKIIVENALGSQVINSAKDKIFDMLSHWDDIDENGIKMSDNLTPEDMFNDYSANYEALKIVSKTQNRLKHLIVSLLTTNKLSARQAVLDLCGGSKTTKDLMKHTNLDSPNLFGTPPESLSEKMNNSMTDKPSPFVLRPGHSKDSSSSSDVKKPSAKRSLSSKNYTPKRFKTADQPPQYSNSAKNILPRRSRAQQKPQRASFRNSFRKKGRR